MVDETIAQSDRVCTICGASKPTGSFYKDKRRNQFQRQCKSCANAATRARRIKNPEKVRECEQKSKKKGRPKWGDKIRAYQRVYRLTWKYGISGSDFYAFLKGQDGRCSICKRDVVVSAPQRGRRDLACVDHDHASGRVRGILCGNCNVAIGAFKDDANLLDSAAEYLRRFK